MLTAHPLERQRESIAMGTERWANRKGRGHSSEEAGREGPERIRVHLRADALLASSPSCPADQAAASCSASGSNLGTPRFHRGEATQPSARPARRSGHGRQGRVLLTVPPPRVALAGPQATSVLSRCQPQPVPGLLWELTWPPRPGHHRTINEGLGGGPG